MDAATYQWTLMVQMYSPPAAEHTYAWLSSTCGRDTKMGENSVIVY